MSEDARYGLTVIAFVGSVFSPYYAWRRRQDMAGCDPLDHVAINVALYAPGSNGQASGPRRWAMTERGRARLKRSANEFRLGASALCWAPDTARGGGRLVIDVDEVSVPWPSRIHGRIALDTTPVDQMELALDARGLHRWRPLAPRATVTVELDAPKLAWSGAGYFDSNSGQTPLESAFATWDWSRAHLRGGRSLIFYDVARLEGTRERIGLAVDAQGHMTMIEGPPSASLARSRWQLARQSRCDFAKQPSVVSTLTDAPFYARSIVASHWLGEPVMAMHESLSLRRFSRPLVQAMLPFRMPRRRD